ncbi:flagellar basal body rod protein FlgB [Intestinimonas sp. MSJ-38]|uniref:flagellar basal body rod protein FlgB n=1 Tax=Intestinimonas sp. MSJ-38 TaxID=2841532 RepID=UPI001C10C707|nr:flagellar basal body rod protein FlgB [Intestinimonas sp. MSJ-38]MBU5432729.1 flagellar basal body rod protein FlgB [Intestinimonas sp. MSJ-38]
MGLLESNSALMLQRSMNFLWTKQSCILDNIANAETPNYKTKYATFEESLDNAIRQAAGEKQGKNTAFREAIEDSRLEVHQAQESTRMDDNGVNITEQAVELARNGYQLQYVMDSISSDFSILRTAIRG